MNWISDRLAIGNFRDAAAATRDEFDAVLCLVAPCSCDDREDLRVLQVPLVDGAGNDPRDVVDAVSFLQELHRDGLRVLVHCHAGRSRSVAVVARFFMTQGAGRSEAVAKIAEKREIYLSEGITEILDVRIPGHR